MMQYRLVPVAEHPLFPGASQALQLTAEQYELLKDDQQVVFASVVKNDEILKRGVSILKSMADPGHSKEQYQGFNLPKI